ncbi:hypothetical protein [Xenorhabdus sp. PB62.4]|uniref:hypothetical protein n=1 Tax=Xenorhabdus sp. PB62.4 TaxID=1851573 RepID=UPI001656FB6C|nr:hypothetical protein [Xenorhabdus sp. PB62.4]
MIRKLLLLSVLVMAGCSTGRIPTDNLSSLNNNELCRTLGDNYINSTELFKAMNEVFDRVGSIDIQECKAIANEVKLTEISLRNMQWQNNINSMNTKFMEDAM